MKDVHGEYVAILGEVPGEAGEAVLSFWRKNYHIGFLYFYIKSRSW